MENNQLNSPNVSSEKGPLKDTKKDFASELYRALHVAPISRRMAATRVGLTDQTYMVTQLIYDWIKQGRAQVVGQTKCARSGRMVEAITTNSEFFISEISNQLTIFDL